MNDRFLRACRREPVDTTPVWFMRQAGRSLPEYREIRKKRGLLEIVANPDLCAEVTLQPVERLGVDAAIVFADITLPFLGMGVDFEIRPGVGPVIEDPVSSESDVTRLRPFTPDNHVDSLLQAIAQIRAASPVPVIGFAGAPFTLASYLVEGGPTKQFSAIKSFMLSRPQAWDQLVRHLTQVTIEYLSAQVEAGAQAIQVFDSWIGALSPDMYRSMVLPHMKSLFENLPPVPKIHFGTSCSELLPSMAEGGGDVIGVDWRIKLDRAWVSVGDRGIQGNLDPAVVAGPWQEIARQAQTILDQAGTRPGHIFNLGHGVLPKTPVDHLARLVDFVHENGAH